MTSNTKTKPYTPDSSDAKSWLTPDIFVWKGRHYKLEPNLRIRKLPKNNHDVTERIKHIRNKLQEVT
jgi:hypothetical protein